MTKMIKHKLISIFLYLAPIIIFTMLIRTVNSFLLSTGIMTILAGLGLRFIPSYMGNVKNKEKNNNVLFISVSGIAMIVVALM